MTPAYAACSSAGSVIGRRQANRSQMYTAGRPSTCPLPSSRGRKLRPSKRNLVNGLVYPLPHAAGQAVP